MKVYLLNPPADRPMIREGRCQSPGNMRKTSIPQLSLAYLATNLRQVGADVRLSDAVAHGRTIDDVLAEIEAYEPRFVLLNTTTPTFPVDVEFIRAFKARLPHILTVLFGAHVTAEHEKVMAAVPEVDVILRGEPEESAVALYEALENDEDIAGIEGTTARRGDEVVAAGTRKMQRELDLLGWPARDLLPNDQYIHPIAQKRYTTVNVSRGCPQRCVFCVAPIYYGKPIRTRSVEDVLDEIEQDVVGRHGIDHCWFYADDLTADKEFLGGLCEGILSRGIKIQWWGNTRADVQDQELYDLMGRSGCMMLSIGGESGSDEILKRARKNIVADDIRITIEQLRHAKILSLVYFIVGLPGETKETIHETVRFAKKVRPNFVEFYPATPYPGTEVGEVAEKDGLITDRDLSRYECGGTEFVIKVEGMTAEELDRTLRWAYRSFYLNPASLRTVLQRFKTPRDLLSLARFGMGYLKRLSSPKS